MRRLSVISVAILWAGLGGASEQFARDCRALCRASHRLSGSAEYHRAAAYVAAQLRAAGADAVIVQPFPSAQTTVKRCELVLGAGGERKSLPLLPARPNGIVPPVSPPEGITGEILHAGKGSLGDYGPRSPEGKIVVLDYNCGDGWLRAFRLGAKAVVFVREGRCESRHAHHTVANANLPRFFYPGAASDLPEGATATVHSEVPWVPSEGRNVLAFFEGTSPQFGQGADEVVVVAANLDSFGEVPRLSPGARGAANCAALLELARHLGSHRPRRHVLLAFLDNQARGHAGCIALYRAIDQSEPTIRLANRERSLANEKTFIAEMMALLERPNPHEADSPVRRELVNRLKQFAATKAFDLRNRLYILRTDRSAEAAADREAEVERLEAEKQRWNDLLRALARRRATKAVEEQLRQALEHVRATLARRLEELDLEERALAADKQINDLVGEAVIVLHGSLLLGDATRRWGLVIGGDSSFRNPNDNPGLYGKLQAVFLNAAKRLGDAVAGFERASADGTLDPPRLLWAAPHLVHSGEVAGRLGIYNLALATAQENLPREGTPDDTLEALDLAGLEAQADEVVRMLAEVASDEGLSLRRSIVADNFYVFPEFASDNRPRGPMVMGRLPGSAMPDRPMPNAIVQVFYRARGQPPYADLAYNPRKPYAFDDFALVRSNQNGSYGLGPAPRWTGVMRGFAATFDERGAVAMACERQSQTAVITRLSTFRCRGGVAVLPPRLRFLPARVFRARGDSPLGDDRSFYETIDGVFYWYCEPKVRRVKFFGEQAVIGLVNESKAVAATTVNPRRARGSQPEGVGFPMEGAWQAPRSSPRSAGDLWRLNEARLEALRSRGVASSSLEELHGRAEDLLVAARDASSVAAREALAACAFLAERPVYSLTRASLNDLVRAVLVLLGLSVPFAFALERLLVGATNVYRQIGWFAGFFVLTFVVLFLSHPAFAIAKTPVIIFLGFAIIVLASLVIVIIMRRFEVELKVVQGLRTTVHAADVSRFSTVMAAVSMGISTMRRRPMRTALTAITIVMLTFTILCFASFGTQTGIVRLFVGPLPGHSGVFIHRVNWRELNDGMLEVIGGRWGKNATLCTRYWISPTTPQNQGPLLSRADGSDPQPLRGLLGIDAAELRARPDMAALLKADPETWDKTVLLTEAAARQAGLKPGDEVLLGGLRLVVGPLVDGSALSGLKDMDESSILPVDFVEMQGMLAQTPEEDLSAALAQQSWASLPTDSVAIVSSANAARMGARLHAISLYTADPRQAGSLAEAVARVFPLPVVATRADGVYRHVLGTVVEASGAGDLLFPIVLGGLVIFGTMLGSVADREKEIYTFSSLGLAPPHVASLFFAEATVYSVLGGLGGYLLAQASMKVLGWLATYGLVRVPEMNYSSTNAIVTILLVMATVLVSSIYPAVKASRSANPGILRTWRLPPPKGDLFEIVFPFTVSEYDFTGIVSFLKEHFENYGESGLGKFMARQPRLALSGDGSLVLKADLALAPYDLGVTQSFELWSRPSEIEGIDEVAIKIRRKSGQPRDWRRLNKVLLDDLRRQFLIWRALPQQTMELYRERTLVELAELKQQTRQGNGQTS